MESDSINEPILKDVLIRLHVRACQITAEIITLLENGFADGAMARWRTLHEIGIVMTLIHDHGEALAIRYVDHMAVEAYASKQQYSLCYEQLGYEPSSSEECKAIEDEYAQVGANYGKEFWEPYGWAHGYVARGAKGRLGLKELEASAGRSAMASHYKFASNNVHAGPNALYYRLGLLSDSILLAGASNAGLSEPGQNTALTFGYISILLIKKCPTLDILVTMRVIEILRRKIPRVFAKAEKKVAIGT